MVNYILKCNNCDYKVESTEEWKLKAKCGIHRRSKGHYSHVLMQGQAIGLAEGVRRQ
jgi:hypothetical protein